MSQHNFPVLKSYLELVQLIVVLQKVHFILFNSFYVNTSLLSENSLKQRNVYLKTVDSISPEGSLSSFQFNFA